VLDVGCGCGATTLAAARAVAPGGHATGVDLSAPMLDVARDRARRQGIANASFAQCDVQAGAPTNADLVVGRFGTMFFSDPVLAFTHLRGALAPGGRLCLATWQPLIANEWLTVPGAALLPFATSAPAEGGGPGMFAQSEPDVVRDILGTAGFSHVDLEPVTVPLHLGATVEDALEHLVDSGPGRAVLAAVPEDRQHAALDAVRAVLRERATAEGIALGGAVWIIRAG
jgi:SAM-dependent methyltransferase